MHILAHENLVEGVFQDVVDAIQLVKTLSIENEKQAVDHFFNFREIEEV